MSECNFNRELVTYVHIIPSSFTLNLWEHMAKQVGQMACIIINK